MPQSIADSAVASASSEGAGRGAPTRNRRREPTHRVPNDALNAPAPPEPNSRARAVAESPSLTLNITERALRDA